MSVYPGNTDPLSSERSGADRHIYLDNASTSFPKAPGVAQAVSDFITGIGANVGRGAYRQAYEAEEAVYEARAALCRLFHGPDPKNVIFTKNITESLNVLIKGILRPGDHVLVSSMEHNALMRPLTQMLRQGVTFSRIPCDRTGALETDRMESLLRPNTRALFLTSASNVSGTLMPLEAAGRFCREHHILFIVDTAQAAGFTDIFMDRLSIDALAFTGHKGLLGPQGIGGFLITDELARETEPLISGGTGSFSDSEEVPRILPDRFEAGTLNLPGIAGLSAALAFLEAETVRNLRSHELSMTKYFLDGLSPMIRQGRIKIAGPSDLKDRTGVVSVVTPGEDPARVAFALDERYGIMTRVGLHCAPSAHKTLGTFPAGTIRFSVGYATDRADIDAALNALDDLLPLPFKG